MKTIVCALIIVCLSFTLKAQGDFKSDYGQHNCLTVGILQGGGSLVGADLEILITRQFGFQLGMGYVGFGGGLNYHLKPSIRSSFLSLQYWNQGIGDSFAQNAIGGTYVFRGKKWFTFQIGLGFPIDKGPAMPDDYVQPPAMLLYSIGAYFPI